MMPSLRIKNVLGEAKRNWTYRHDRTAQQGAMMTVAEREKKDRYTS